MKRTNIFLRDDQRTGLIVLAQTRKTTAAHETREAVDAHLEKHKPKNKKKP